MTDNELLLSISNMMDVKLKAELEPIKTDIKSMKENISGIKLDIENVIEPKLKLLAENYVPAAKQYEKSISSIDSMQADIEIIKKVVQEHSEKLKKNIIIIYPGSVKPIKYRGFALFYYVRFMVIIIDLKGK